MDRTEFLNSIDGARDINDRQKNFLHERTKLVFELQEVQKKRFRKDKFIYGFSIIVAFFALFVASGIAQAVYMSGVDSNGWFLLAVVSAGAIGFFATKTLLSHKYDADYWATFNDYSNRMKEKTKEIDALKEELSRVFKGDLTPKYCTYVVLWKIEEYFRDGRVDNTKEAVNLFVQENGIPEDYQYTDEAGTIYELLVAALMRN